MTDKINHNQVAKDENFNFFHHYYNDETELINSDNDTKYYSTDEFKNDIGINSTKESFGCLSLNCQSIGGHWTALKQFLSEINGDTFTFDVIGLSETFRVPPNILYTLNGYHSFEHKTRPEGDDGRGGVGLFINSNLKYTVREDLSIFTSHVIESLFIELEICTTKSIIIGIVYRPNTPPRASLDKFTESIGHINDQIALENKTAIIMGDFNIDLLKYGNHPKTKLFVDNMFSHGLLPQISRPTRVTEHTATIIDHIYTNKIEANTQSGIILTDVADHYGTFFIEHKKLKHQPYKDIKIRKHTPVNLKIFKNLLSAHDFKSINDHEDPDEAYNKFINEYDELYNIAFPLLTIRQTRKNTKKEPWITSGLLKSANQKNKLMLKK